MAAEELRADTALQQRLLGVGRHDDEAEDAADDDAGQADRAPEPVVYRVRREAANEDAGPVPGAGPSGSRRDVPTRWSQANPLARRARDGDGDAASGGDSREAARDLKRAAPPIPFTRAYEGAAYVVGTFDTKARELRFIAQRLEAMGRPVVTVDLSTSGRPSTADVGPTEVASHHPGGAHAVFTADRGSAVSAMAVAFERFLPGRRDLAGVISAGGSGGTALATPAMQRLPVGVPKVMVSTVASGDVSSYVGPTDITMMYSVTDVQGLNRISEQVLANAAHALGGMIANAGEDGVRGRGGAGEKARPAVGLSMFGVTTPCVQQAQRLLEDEYDCLVFHATGTGGQSMEKLAESGMLAGVIDATTTEIADLLMGGVFSAGEGRLDAVARSRVPYVGSCGALDMVNWGALDTVPERFKNRTLYKHNPQVTLMRTTAEENAAMGRWIAEKLNRCEGPVRFLIPEGGVSLLDAPGMPFHDPEADAALFNAIEETFRPTANRRLIRLKHNINDPAFSEALVEQFRAIQAPAGGRALGARTGS
ncbi:Tm-1-like ATP-binding domain-containing protein [Marivibrio halodurans]|uniref:UPF0261 protein KAJ83_15130 n=2 Tax=Marivibrio halodurans TaxID=2039722 RepID=A0A8J7SKB3_9PROT|nr:Tm-1-like ATP-binding domain-containing protein [Marivibrio halodurans]